MLSSLCIKSIEFEDVMGNNRLCNISVTERLCGEESRDAAPHAEDNDKGDNFSMDSHKIKVHEALIKKKEEKEEYRN